LVVGFVVASITGSLPGGLGFGGGFFAGLAMSMLAIYGLALIVSYSLQTRQERDGATKELPLVRTGGRNRQMQRAVVSIVITTVALAAVVAHLIWPDLAIDAIALALVGIAILPWLGLILESIEWPGGFNATVREVKETTEEVKETTQAALSETQAVKETAQEALSQTQEVKETAQAALSETQAVKETAQAALSRTEEIDKKVSQ
jgi:ABC-type multidrug transport system fused ATPase/permease subunit